jgi:hypothetical protein
METQQQRLVEQEQEQLEALQVIQGCIKGAKVRQYPMGFTEEEQVSLDAMEQVDVWDDQRARAREIFRRIDGVAAAPCLASGCASYG